MSPGDIFMLVMRWMHLVSAAAWVGGSLFYLLVLRPALRRAPDPPRVAATREFRALIDTSILVLLVTGIMLTFHRLSPGVAGWPYVATLAVKIVLSLWMFHLARGRRRYTPLSGPSEEAPASSGRLLRVLRSASGYNAIVILGIIVFLLADLLKVLYEMALPDP